MTRRDSGTSWPDIAAQEAGDPLVVELCTGPVRGADTGTAHTFTGIPYAAPPVGPLRWRDPQPVAPWDDVVEATTPGSLCPQLGPFGEGASEDCLFLNVTAPRERTGALPVLVWLHGGGYTVDGGSLYDAQRLAAQGDVIVVTVNYRLGIFGYFGHPGLPGSGNFGLADQLASLRWVRRNAAAFGGDPGNVTLFGQSAGAMSASALLTSPAAAGLFHKVILQSGPGLLHWGEGVMFPNSPAHTPYASRATVDATGVRVAAALGCRGSDAVELLRHIPVSDLLEHTGEFANHLAYGTPLLPRDPAEALRRREFHRVPVISGGTRDEMRPFIGGASLLEPITGARYPELLRHSFGDDADRVATRYPLEDYESAAMAWATVTTDASWARDTAAANRLLARHCPVYAYEFADRTAPNVNGMEIAGLPMGAAHASELPYLFDLLGHDLLTPQQHQLGDTMIAHWTTFARTGDPNGPGNPDWPRFDHTGRVLQFAPGAVHPVDHRARHQCDFWDRLR
ncbi:carboxylesterase/lipase family protein [Prauserella cavernicola]|uniref:Carboxylic ester hydrolase n=1 Tax=Prauserella cavernicola TaxID=2800127 RepID=A0A934QW32_9PSEU|nr:carboxylesterase family protein [Prauserella cavernicola]MBK1787650.1 carboxylesterase family protein [Prauserella cavernicola]